MTDFRYFFYCSQTKCPIFLPFGPRIIYDPNGYVPLFAARHHIRVHWYFQRAYSHHLQCWRVSQVRIKHEAGAKLHRVTSQNTAMFIVIVVGTLHPMNDLWTLALNIRGPDKPKLNSPNAKRVQKLLTSDVNILYHDFLFFETVDKYFCRLHRELVPLEGNWS